MCVYIIHCKIIEQEGLSFNVICTLKSYRKGMFVCLWYTNKSYMKGMFVCLWYTLKSYRKVSFVCRYMYYTRKSYSKVNFVCIYFLHCEILGKLYLSVYDIFWKVIDKVFCLSIFYTLWNYRTRRFVCLCHTIKGYRKVRFVCLYFILWKVI